MKPQLLANFCWLDWLTQNKLVGLSLVVVIELRQYMMSMKERQNSGPTHTEIEDTQTCHFNSTTSSVGPVLWLQNFESAHEGQGSLANVNQSEDINLLPYAVQPIQLLSSGALLSNTMDCLVLVISHVQYCLSKLRGKKGSDNKLAEKLRGEPYFELAVIWGYIGLFAY